MAKIEKLDDEQLSLAYRKADLRNKGSLNITEFKNALHTLGEDVKEDTLAELLKRAGIEEDAGISYGMFLTLVRRLAKEQREQKCLNRVFNEFDHDSKGYILPSNIRRVLIKFNIDPNESEIEHMMEAADTNEDGKVDFEEFMHIFSKN
ncbi:calmodulin [Nematostella vectensis]|uniref:calmodulin n=1 Tax=Nematostella vectensis TaxID=45351 RepID=UPI0013900C0E|nr:calmodulin [Nematostella vectensis]